jgi:hypothetical protein
MKSGPRWRANAGRGPDPKEVVLPMADQNPTYRGFVAPVIDQRNRHAVVSKVSNG